MNLLTILIVFGVIFVAELPDKSMLALLALSARFPKRAVWIGAALAFLVHVIIAVTIGHFLAALPIALVQIIVALLFAVGAVILLVGKHEDMRKVKKETSAEMKHMSRRHPLKVIAGSFLIIFLGEWGDITQLVTANYAAKYHDVLSVGIGATLGLWAVAAFGIIVGAKIVKHIPTHIFQRAIGVILLAFAVGTVIPLLTSH